MFIIAFAGNLANEDRPRYRGAIATSRNSPGIMLISIAIIYSPCYIIVCLERQSSISQISAVRFDASATIPECCQQLRLAAGECVSRKSLRNINCRTNIGKVMIGIFNQVQVMCTRGPIGKSSCINKSIIPWSGSTQRHCINIQLELTQARSDLVCHAD